MRYLSDIGYIIQHPTAVQNKLITRCKMSEWFDLEYNKKHTYCSTTINVHLYSQIHIWCNRFSVQDLQHFFGNHRKIKNTRIISILVLRTKEQPTIAQQKDMLNKQHFIFVIICRGTGYICNCVCMYVCVCVCVCVFVCMRICLLFLIAFSSLD